MKIRNIIHNSFWWMPIKIMNNIKMPYYDRIDGSKEIGKRKLTKESLKEVKLTKELHQRGVIFVLLNIF